MKFRYKKFRHGLLRPIIPVGVSYRGKTIIQEVLIDSGADICIFDAEIGEAIELDNRGWAKLWPQNIHKTHIIKHRLPSRVFFCYDM